MFHPRKFFKRIGPGVITGASDDDPSGIATYSQTGAQFGYGLLWLSLYSTPLMLAAQEMSARLGMVTGHGLAHIIRHKISARVVLVVSLLLFIANTINIGADLSAMAAAMRLLIGIPAWFLILAFALGIVLLEISLSYRKYVNILRWLTLGLFAYVAAAFFTHQDWPRVLLDTIVPHLQFNQSSLAIVVAILGTTISPYCFFWQTSEEVEEEIAAGKQSLRARKRIGSREIRSMRRDVASGMFFSNIIMFFIIVTTAATLHATGTTITTATDAAVALKPLAGDASFLLFTLGIVGTGLLAIPILAGSASYAIAEVFGWREGLSQPFRKAHAFYGVMVLAVGLGVALNFFGISPVTFLINAAVVNGFVAPVMLWYIIRLADRQDVVGKHTSPFAIRIAGWSTFVVMTVAALLLLVWMLR